MTHPNTPKHLIERVIFARGISAQDADTVAPIWCRCGWSGVTAYWRAHRAEHGELGKGTYLSRRDGTGWW